MAAERRIDSVKAILDEIGLGGERLEMHFLSSAEGTHWAEIVTGMTKRIMALGPNPLRRDG
jgi:F420-non-reducing hydrogenase iron-sulfur subunit